MRNQLIIRHVLFLIQNNNWYKCKMRGFNPSMCFFLIIDLAGYVSIWGFYHGLINENHKFDYESI